MDSPERPFTRGSRIGSSAKPRKARARLWIAATLGLVTSPTLVACVTSPEQTGETGAGYIFYPPAPLQPRIQFLASFASDVDVLPEQSGFQRLIMGEREGKGIGKPYGVAMHEGKIFVCDTRASAVVIFDLENRAVGLLGHLSPGKLDKPVNISIDEDGTRYVADVDLRRLMLYDRDNRFLRSFGDPKRWKPSDVVIDGRRLYVTDVANGQVVVLDKASGEEIERLARRGSGEGELFFPTNLDVDEAGNIYVSDTGNFRVLEFDSQGRQLQQIGSLGNSTGKLVRPKGVAVDREDRVYVVDAAFENVQIFGSDGKLLLFFGTAGNHPGGINLPTAVSIDYDNVDVFADRVAPGHSLEYLVLVTSQFGANKVNVYGFLNPRELED